jgi:hypothetical protein
VGPGAPRSAVAVDASVLKPTEVSAVDESAFDTRAIAAEHHESPLTATEILP